MSVKKWFNLIEGYPDSDDVGEEVLFYNAKSDYCQVVMTCDLSLITDKEKSVEQVCYWQRIFVPRRKRK